MLLTLTLSLLAVGWMIAFAFPETDLGRTLRRWLVDAPGRWLSHLTPMKIVLAAIVLVTIVAVSMVAPLDLAFLFAGDAATYVEVAAAIWLVAARVQLGRWSGIAWRAAMRRLRETPALPADPDCPGASASSGAAKRVTGHTHAEPMTRVS